MDALVTVTGPAEAKTAVRAGPDILDVKNPGEGSLGAPAGDTIAGVMDAADGTPVSIAAGDVPDLPGTVGLAVRGAAAFDPAYIKIGLKGSRTVDEAVAVARAAVDAAAGSDAAVVLAGYADHEAVGAVAPRDVPEVGQRSGADVVMVDTAVKDGTTLLDHMDDEALAGFVDAAHGHGMRTAAAGSLGIDDVDTVRAAGFDVLGVRGAVCRGGSRTGTIDPDRVVRLVDAV